MNVTVLLSKKLKILEQKFVSRLDISLFIVAVQWYVIFFVGLMDVRLYI